MTPREENPLTFFGIGIWECQGKILGEDPFLIFIDEFLLYRERAFLLTKFEIGPADIQFAGTNGFAQVTHSAGIEGFGVLPFHFQVMDYPIAGFEKTLEELTFFQTESAIDTKLVNLFKCLA